MRFARTPCFYLSSGSSRTVFMLRLRRRDRCEWRRDLVTIPLRADSMIHDRISRDRRSA